MGGTSVTAGMFGAGVEVRIHIVVAGVEGLAGRDPFTTAGASGQAAGDEGSSLLTLTLVPRGAVLAVL